MKNLLNRKLFDNYSLFDKFLNPYLNPSLMESSKKKKFQNTKKYYLKYFKNKTENPSSPYPRALY
jgi:hypothetical protein